MARTLDFALPDFFGSLVLDQSTTCTLIRIGSCFRNGQQEDCQYTSSDKYDIDIQQHVVRQVKMAVDGKMNELYTHFTAGIMVTSLIIIYLALCFTQAWGPATLDNLVRFLAI